MHRQQRADRRCCHRDPRLGRHPARTRPGTRTSRAASSAAYTMNPGLAQDGTLLGGRSQARSAHRAGKPLSHALNPHMSRPLRIAIRLLCGVSRLRDCARHGPPDSACSRSFTHLGAGISPASCNHRPLRSRPRTRRLRTPARRGPSPAPASMRAARRSSSPAIPPSSRSGNTSERDRTNRSTADLFGAFSRPACPARYGAWSGTAAPGGRAGTGAGVFSRSASAWRCSPVSGGAASISSRTQASRAVPGSHAGCPSWSGRSPRRLSAAGPELTGRVRVPGRLGAAVLVSRCGADPLARMNWRLITSGQTANHGAATRTSLHQPGPHWTALVMTQPHWLSLNSTADFSDGEHVNPGYVGVRVSWCSP